MDYLKINTGGFLAEAGKYCQKDVHKAGETWGGTWGAGASQFLEQNFGNTDRHLIVGKKFKHSVIYLGGL